MNDTGYPAVRLKRTPKGYATFDGRYTVERDEVSDIGSSNAGCYKPCWHVFKNGVRIAKFLDTLREARTEIACAIESEGPHA